MEKTKMLNQIRTLLKLEVKLEDMKLENGTMVTAETFEKGSEIFIDSDGEKIAMPVGEYILEDGRLLVVEAEGLIADVREVSDEVPAKEETEDLEEVIETEVPEEVATEVEAIVEAVVEVIAPVIEEVKTEIEELKKLYSENKKKEKMSAARKPLRHSPEAKAPQKQDVQFGKGQFNTTLHRVLSKLNK
tara:strand:- start:85 stop:651 length:567 start_codon:yes stop_codon:yes gene_type:complete